MGDSVNRKLRGAYGAAAHFDAVRRRRSRGCRCRADSLSSRRYGQQRAAANTRCISDILKPFSRKRPMRLQRPAGDGLIASGVAGAAGERCLDPRQPPRLGADPTHCDTRGTIRRRHAQRSRQRRRARTRTRRGRAASGSDDRSLGPAGGSRIAVISSPGRSDRLPLRRVARQR